MFEFPLTDYSKWQKNEALCKEISVCGPRVTIGELSNGYVETLFKEGLCAVIICYSNYVRSPAVSKYFIALGYPVVNIEGGFSKLASNVQATNYLLDKQLVITAAYRDLRPFEQYLRQFIYASYFDSEPFYETEYESVRKRIGKYF